MVDVRYAGEAIDRDQPAYEAQQADPTQPIHVRTAVTLLQRKTGSHKSWPGVAWTVVCKDADEAIALREALAAFFRMVGAHGPDKVRVALTPTSG